MDAVDGVTVPRQVDIFISSPGDVAPERRRTALVVRRLEKEFGRFLTLRAVLWEYEPMLATGHFQDALVPPSQTDVVVVILWSRLGSPLPAPRYQGIDGRSPVTGTEWEYEDAVRAQRERGAPAVLLYRKLAPAIAEYRTAQDAAALVQQKQALDAFWSRHVEQTAAAFTGFESLDQLEAQIEEHLRKLLLARVARDSSDGAGRIAWHAGSPFRGLARFEAEHAPIFFGRHQVQRRAVESITAAAGAGCAFLLVSGPSGSGKSSLIRAGAIPDLTTPGVVGSVTDWTICIFEIGASSEADLWSDLARRLAAAIPALEASGVDIATLSAQLQSADPTPLLRLALRRSPDRAGPERRPALVLFVDQYEQAFARDQFGSDVRSRFLVLLDRLARSGDVWVIVALRSDFLHRAIELPGFAPLVEAGAHVMVTRPRPSEIDQIIQLPAAAAGIGFETDLETGVSLAAELRDAAIAAQLSLPLLEFALEELYRIDVGKQGRTTLTHATFRAMGGVAGAIASHATAVAGALDVALAAQLPDLLRLLVTIDEDTDEVISRAVRRAAVKAAGLDRLAEQLIAARLVSATGDDEAAELRLAHETLIAHWPLLADVVLRDRELLRARARVIASAARWRSEHENPAYLLAAGKPLLDARAVLGERRALFDADAIGFIERSIEADEQRTRLRDAERRAKLRRARWFAAITAALAALAFVGYVIAARERADKQREAENARLGRDTALQSEAALLVNLTRTALDSHDRNHAVQYALRAVATSDARGGHTTGGGYGAAEAVLSEALASGPIVRRIHARPGEHIAGADLDPAARRILALTRRGHAFVIDARTGGELSRLSDPAITDPIAAADLSRTGDRILTVTAKRRNDGQRGDLNGAQLWDAATGKLLDHWTTGEASLITAALTDAGPIAVARLQDGEFVVAELTSRRALCRAPRPQGAGEDFMGNAFIAPTGRAAVIADRDWESLVLCRLDGPTTPAIPLRFPGAEVGVFSYQVSFSADGRWILATQGQGGAVIWSSETGALRAVIDGDGNPIETAMFNPDATRVVTVSIVHGSGAMGDGKVRIWDLDGRRIKVARTNATVRSLAVAEHQFAAALDDGSVVIDTLERDFADPDEAVGAMVLQPQGQLEQLELDRAGSRMLGVLADGTAAIWSLAEPALYDQPGATVWAARFDPAGRSVAMAIEQDQQGAVRIQDLSSGRVVTIPTVEPHGVAFSPDGTAIAIAGTPPIVRSVGDSPAVKQELPRHRKKVNWIGFSAAGDAVVTASQDGTAVIFDLRTRQSTTLNSGKPFWSAEFSHRGDRVVTGGEARVVQIWNRAGAVQRELPMPADIIAVEFAPDDAQVAIATMDGLVTLWNLETNVPTRLLGHRSGVLSIAYSPDGRFLASGSEDRTIRLWSTVTANQLAVWSEHAAAVRTVAFSPDGRKIVSASLDGSVRLRDLPVPRDGLRAFAALLVGPPEVAPPASTENPGCVALGDDDAAADRDPDEGPAPQHANSRRALVAMACEAQLRKQPDDARTKYLLANALDPGPRRAMPFDAGPRRTKLLEEAAVARLPQAMAALGRERYEAGKRDEAMLWFQMAADAGDADAPADLAWALLDAPGDHDVARVRSLFQLSTDRRSAQGNIGLGFLAETGTGEPQAPVKALSLYARPPESRLAIDRRAALALTLPYADDVAAMNRAAGQNLQ